MNTFLFLICLITTIIESNADHYFKGCYKLRRRKHNHQPHNQNHLHRILINTSNKRKCYKRCKKMVGYKYFSISTTKKSCYCYKKIQRRHAKKTSCSHKRSFELFKIKREKKKNKWIRLDKESEWEELMESLTTTTRNSDRQKLIKFAHNVSTKILICFAILNSICCIVFWLLYCKMLKNYEKLNKNEKYLTADLECPSEGANTIEKTQENPESIYEQNLEIKTEENSEEIPEEKSEIKVGEKPEEIPDIKTEENPEEKKAEEIKDLD